MNTAAAGQESHFRGYWSIKEVTDNMDRLANWMQTNKPECHEMTLKRADYDLLKRWPKAATLLHISEVDGELRYRGFRLKSTRSRLAMRSDDQPSGDA